VTVAYATANGTATAGSDYSANSATLTFAPGETSQTITILIKSDRVGEPNETFMVNLSGATGGAVIIDGQGVGTIVDDEPRISIGDVARSEGNSGTTLLVFTVTLSAASDVAVTVNFATANGTAKAGEDYDAQSGPVNFAPGETTKTISIAVKGDRKKEGDETFFINLTGALGALVLDGQGVGSILDDDRR
jgi:chitinase